MGLPLECLRNSKKVNESGAEETKEKKLRGGLRARMEADLPGLALALGKDSPSAPSSHWRVLS